VAELLLYEPAGKHDSQHAADRHQELGYGVDEEVEEALVLED
jgi:hypothetical protein